MATVSVRYIVDDVDAAIAFYCQHLGFEEQMHPAPAFAMLTRGDLRLLLSAPGGGPAGRGAKSFCLVSGCFRDIEAGPEATGWA